MKKLILTFWIYLATSPAFAADLIVINPGALSKMDGSRTCTQQLIDHGTESVHDITLPAYCYKTVQLATTEELTVAVKNLDQKLETAHGEMQAFLRKDSREKQMIIREIMADPEFKAEILKFVKEELRKN